MKAREQTLTTWNNLKTKFKLTLAQKDQTITELTTELTQKESELKERFKEKLAKATKEQATQTEEEEQETKNDIQIQTEIKELTETLTKLWADNEYKDRVIKKQEQEHQKLKGVAEEALKELQKPVNKRKTKEKTKKEEEPTHTRSSALQLLDSFFNVKKYQNIHRDFDEELMREWIKRHFTYEQTKEWINIGLTPRDANFCYWIKKYKKKTPEWCLNYRDLTQLRKEFKKVPFFDDKKQN